MDKSQTTSKDSLFLLTIRDDACYSYRQNTFSNRNVILLWLCPVPAGCLGIDFLFLKCTGHTASQLMGLEMSNRGTWLEPQDTEGQQQKASAEVVSARLPGHCLWHSQASGSSVMSEVF